MPGIALQQGIGELEDIKARAVGHCLLHCFQVELATFAEQLELFDLLRCRQQVAFHPDAQQIQRIRGGMQPGCSQSAAHPFWKLLGIDGPHLHEASMLMINQCLGPFAALSAAIQAGQADQQSGIGWWVFQPGEQGLCPFITGFAAGDAQLYQALLGKQGQTVAGLPYLAPVKTAIDVKYQPLLATRCAAGAADQIRAFAGQQRIIAADYVDWRQAFG